jgi:hypothetical protein
VNETKKEEDMFSRISLISLLLIGSTILTPCMAQAIPNPDSPFGFIMGNPLHKDKTLNGMIDLGAKWIRLSGAAGIVWDMVEHTQNTYNWNNADSMISAFYDAGINVLVTIGVSNNAYQSINGYLPADSNAYKTFISKMAERYDGDGIDDAPGSPVVSAWQIGNEVDGWWKDTNENYATLMKESYSTIKSVNPKAKILIAGMAGPLGISKYSSILSYINNGNYLDVFDFHWHATSGGNYKNHNTRNPDIINNFDQLLSEIKNTLNNNNYINSEIWTTEMSISDINPAGQTEKLQAVDLVKRYVYPGAKGVDIIFWGTLYEQSGFGGVSGNTNYFNTQGLINNPLNDGLSHKKLSYYTYKKMVEVLEGSDWKNIATIQEQNGIYIYKFTKQGTPIWVAWNDSNATRTVTISGITSDRVKTTEAVPKYESGKDVIDYTKAFQTDTLVVSNGSVALTLGVRPVFVELLTATSVEHESENIPKEFVLYQNYPNPFNPVTTIRFSLPHHSFVTLKVFDLLGREVATLVDGEKDAGEHTVVYDAKGLASGIYFYRLTTGTFVQQKKMVVMQ